MAGGRFTALTRTNQTSLPHSCINIRLRTVFEMGYEPKGQGFAVVIFTYCIARIMGLHTYCIDPDKLPSDQAGLDRPGLKFRPVYSSDSYYQLKSVLHTPYFWKLSTIETC